MIMDFKNEKVSEKYNEPLDQSAASGSSRVEKETNIATILIKNNKFSEKAKAQEEQYNITLEKIEALGRKEDIISLVINR